MKSYDEWKRTREITLDEQLTFLRLTRDIMEWNELSSPQLEYLISKLWTKKEMKNMWGEEHE